MNFKTAGYEFLIYGSTVVAVVVVVVTESSATFNRKLKTGLFQRSCKILPLCRRQYVIAVLLLLLLLILGCKSQSYCRHLKSSCSGITKD